MLFKKPHQGGLQGVLWSGATKNTASSLRAPRQNFPLKAASEKYRLESWAWKELQGSFNLTQQTNPALLFLKQTEQILVQPLANFPGRRFHNLPKQLVPLSYSFYSEEVLFLFLFLFFFPLKIQSKFALLKNKSIALCPACCGKAEQLFSFMAACQIF